MFLQKEVMPSLIVGLPGRDDGALSDYSRMLVSPEWTSLAEKVWTTLGENIWTRPGET